jgi:hypothetical protein
MRHWHAQIMTDLFDGTHAPGRIEHSLCGMAPDAFDTGDSERPIVFAMPGELVTCPSCRAEMDHVRANFRRYRYVGDS